MEKLVKMNVVRASWSELPDDIDWSEIGEQQLPNEIYALVLNDVHAAHMDGEAVHYYKTVFKGVTYYEVDADPIDVTLWKVL